MDLKMKKRSLAFVLSMTLMFTSLVFTHPSTIAHAATQAELEAEIGRIDDEIEKNKEELSSLAGQKDKQEKYLTTLQSQIDSVEKKVSTLETQIQTIDAELSEYEKQLKQLKNEIDVIKDEITLTGEEIVNTQNQITSSKDVLSSKLRASYVNGKDSTLKILMGSKSLSSFLTRLEMMKRASEDDKKVINEFKEQVTKLTKAKKELEEKKSTLDEKQSSVESMQAKSLEKKAELVKKQTEYTDSVAELEDDYAEVQDFIAELDRNSAAYQSYIKKLQAEKEAADKEIEEIIKSYQATTQPTTQETTLYASNSDPTSSSSSSSGGSSSTPSYSSSESWAWPLGNASTKISSGYGYRDASISGWSSHGGIDIVGKVKGYIFNKPVYASRSGVVISAVWSNSGYGNYLVIDHGDGFSTVYAHCNSLSVSKGQRVEKGQHIANVGSTGNSTGPHLHFEVRYNGAKQNPLNYVSIP